MQGIVSRMKAHQESCRKRKASEHEESPISNKPMKITKFVSATSKEDKNDLDKKVASYFYATNTPFLHVEHKTFKDLCSRLRPSYTPPNRFQIGGKLLDEVHTDCGEKAKSYLKDNFVTLNLDGWSNIHNEPIICVSATTKGNTFLLETIDTTGMAHTAENLVKIAEDSIEKNVTKFGFKVCGFVTDNAANVLKMRKQLSENKKINQTCFLFPFFESMVDIMYWY